MTLQLVRQSAPEVSFDQADGERVAGNQLWRDRTVVLVFLRHFG